MSKSGHGNIDTWALDETRRIITGLVGDKGIRVYLHGSRARNEACRHSDIDIALDGGGKAVDPALLAQIREALEESHIPYTVDLMDMAHADEKFRERIRREGILWNA